MVSREMDGRLCVLRVSRRLWVRVLLGGRRGVIGVYPSSFASLVFFCALGSEVWGLEMESGVKELM